MAVNRERKLVLNEAADLYFNSDTLDEAITKLENLREIYGGDATVQRRREYEDEYLAVMVMQPETDGEMQRRIKWEEQREADAAERDLREFERLSKLFGKG
jgi:siroheme synthase (precorrin-2 oxidase/ferrochelatase)